MVTIKTQITPLIEHVSQIARSSGEQSAAAGNITASMQHIADVIVDSATIARQTKNTASELSKAAADLQGMVQRFKV